MDDEPMMYSAVESSAYLVISCPPVLAVGLAGPDEKGPILGSVHIGWGFKVDGISH